MVQSRQNLLNSLRVRPSPSEETASRSILARFVGPPSVPPMACRSAAEVKCGEACVRTLKSSESFRLVGFTVREGCGMMSAAHKKTRRTAWCVMCSSGRWWVMGWCPDGNNPYVACLRVSNSLRPTSYVLFPKIVSRTEELLRFPLKIDKMFTCFGVQIPKLSPCNCRKDTRLS